MALKSTAKAEATFRDLKERLALRVAGSARIDTVRADKDANGWPMLVLSDGGVETAGNPVVALRMKAADAVSKDIFGNDLAAFAPHEIEVAYELDSTEAEPDRKDLAIVYQEVAKIGAKIVVKEVADATAVSEASLNATAAALELEADIQWPTKGI